MMVSPPRGLLAVVPEGALGVDVVVFIILIACMRKSKKDGTGRA